MKLGHKSDSVKALNIVTDVWIFDSMINENFSCLSKSHFRGAFMR